MLKSWYNLLHFIVQTTTPVEHGTLRQTHVYLTLPPNIEKKSPARPGQGNKVVFAINLIKKRHLEI